MNHPNYHTIVPAPTLSVTGECRCLANCTKCMSSAKAGQTSIPFGYPSCTVVEDGGRKHLCLPEHPGSIHPVAEEAEAVQEMFNRYASGRLQNSKAEVTCLQRLYHFGS
jgi:hypothetical protein